MTRRNALIIILALFAACTKAPEPIEPTPTKQQVEWQKMETYAFVHFGLNTFNDLEWGYGNTPATTFNPTLLDCEQWVRTFKECGLKGVILTAKHHDGFCLWPTSTTDYNISNSPYKDGNGDLVRELSDACHKYGLKFGLYLSPWDRNNAEYGKPGYIETYHQQINELVTSYGPLFEFWFDGANGGNGWYGGADESRSIVASEYYDYQRAKDTILRYHPDAMIFGGSVPTIRWIGNEQGWAGATQWCPVSMDYMDDCEYLTQGSSMGNTWLPAEVDVSIRPGWFYHAREDCKLKSLAKLTDIYYQSVGHNANLLLNFPINLNGKICTNDSLRIVEWHQTLQEALSDDLLQNATVTASNERGRRFSANKVIDSQYDTYWATEDGVQQGKLCFDFNHKVALNTVMIQEYIPLGQRVEQFSLERFVNGKWLPIDIDEETTTIGYKRIIRFKTIEMNRLRIRFKRAKGPLCINHVSAYCARPILPEPEIQRNFDNEVSISCSNHDAKIYYTINGAIPTEASNLYTKPFTVDYKAVVMAIAVDAYSHETSAVQVKQFDLPTTSFKILKPNNGSEKRLFDGNIYSSTYLFDKENVIELQLKEKMNICGFKFMPCQARDASEQVASFELYVDNKKVSEGMFANIKNNPIEQTIWFDKAVMGKKVKFIATGFVDQAPRGAVAEFSIITD